MYKYLNFYNKAGEYLNFEYDNDNDKWIGRLDFNVISVDLIEDFQLYILEEVFDTNNSKKTYVTPHIDSSYLPGATSPVGSTGATSASIAIDAYFDPKKPVKDIFIYNFELGPTTNYLTKYNTISFDFDFDAAQTITGPTSTYPGIKETSVITEKAIQINIGFCPSMETAYQSILYIKDVDDHVIAEVTLYGEGEEEDERLRDMITNLGIELLPEDTIIFDTSDVNEENIDWKLLNNKRKEILLEYHNIFPFMGSYKALINIIKFFGYQNVRMKEYWLNVDQSSVNFGKYRQTEIDDLFTEDANFNTSRLIPSKIYKKTSKFGLFYDITTETGKFDEDGIPIVEEVFNFSQQEILIKLFALKRKLKNYFLPLNARIVDIVGESVFYAKYDINIWNDQSRIDSVSSGIKPEISILPKINDLCYYIQDLRYLEYFGCPIGPDLNLGGLSNLLSWRVGLASSIALDGVADRVQNFSLSVSVPVSSTIQTITAKFREDSGTGQVKYEPYEIADRLIENWYTNSYLSTNFVAYQEGGSSGIVRIVQKEPIGDGAITTYWTSDTDPGGSITGGGWKILGPTSTILTASPGGTALSINISTGPSGSFGTTGAPISYYDDCFLGFFDRSNVPLSELNDAEGISVGAPIVLSNDTFNITWEDAAVTYNQIDQPNANGLGLSATPLFSQFTNSFTISGYTSISVGVTASVTAFPYSDFPSLYNYTWNNIGLYGYYEMQWIVSKKLDDTPAFYHDSGVKSIEEILTYPLILPYIGSYKVELYMWDGYNTRSSLITENLIDVCLPESDFIGWYSSRELKYTWNDNIKIPQSDYAKEIPVLGTPKPKLTWNEYATTWDLPFQPNEEIGMADLTYNNLDAIEFYQTSINPISSPLIDKSPYKFNLIERFATWNDAYHLWWDNTGTKITQWEITGVTGPTSIFFMSKGNTTVDLINSGVYFEEGPTGFEGATANPSIGSPVTGDVVVSQANRRTYQYDGISWNYIIDIIDTFVATNLIGSDIEKMRGLTKQLNQTLPIDGISHPYFNDFIYYYNEDYDSTYSLIPYIRAVSKDFDKGKRHIIGASGAISDNKSYETVYFGYLGDIPTHFEIYEVDSTGPTGSILISGMTASYSIGSTNLIDLQNELNGPTAQATFGIRDFEYNIVLGSSGWTGGSGPTTNTSVKLQGVAKAFKSPEEISITYDGGINGTGYGRSLIKNIDWDELRILKYSQELPLLSLVNFTYDNSKVKGKKNPKWIMSKEDDQNFTDIYHNNKYFTYLFTRKGSYTISLELEDTNGNKKTITKQEIIKIT